MIKLGSKILNHFTTMKNNKHAKDALLLKKKERLQGWFNNFISKLGYKDKVALDHVTKQNSHFQQESTHLPENKFSSVLKKMKESSQKYSITIPKMEFDISKINKSKQMKNMKHSQPQAIQLDHQLKEFLHSTSYNMRNNSSIFQSISSNPAKMIFILGGPGSGKGTQCDIMVKRYGFIHLSTGDLLREQIKNGSPFGHQLDKIMKEGKLISSDLMVRLIQQKIESNNYKGRYILDGFPRCQQNINVWTKIMANNVDLASVIYFECTQDKLRKRLLERGKTSGRSDDNQVTISKRLKVFNDQTKEVINFYEKQGKLHKICANRSVEEIASDVQRILDSLEIYANID